MHKFPGSALGQITEDSPFLPVCAAPTAAEQSHIAACVRQLQDYGAQKILFAVKSGIAIL